METKQRICTGSFPHGTLLSNRYCGSKQMHAKISRCKTGICSGTSSAKRTIDSQTATWLSENQTKFILVASPHHIWPAEKSAPLVWQSYHTTQTSRSKALSKHSMHFLGPYSTQQTAIVFRNLCRWHSVFFQRPRSWRSVWTDIWRSHYCRLHGSCEFLPWN